jgi:type VI secretion system secreted protein VgrG
MDKPLEFSFFNYVMDYVLRNEGGYSNDPDDPGGPTNFGITQHDLAIHRGVPVSADEVKNMTVDEAKEIYFAHYWVPLNLSQLHAAPIATCIMDTGVLYGTTVGAVFAQRVCVALGHEIAVDGKLGPQSVEALNSVDVKTFLKTYVANIHARINGIIRAHPRELKFKAGWELRADRLLTLA